MSTTVATPAPAAPVSPWFRSAPFDLLLILGVPFLTWPLVMAAQGAWGPDLLTQLILLTATGHYFATFVRVYGDRELFERFRVRFLVAPPVLLVTCWLMLSGEHAGALLLVTAMWAFWHWLAQAFGFARIYDMKVGSFRPRTAWLDKALVIAGFVGAATLNDGAVATFGKAFLGAGIPLPDGATFDVVQAIVLVAVVAVSVAYVANLAWTIACGEPWSWQKQFMHATTIGYYWFAFTWLPNVLVAYVLYELFHDIQYYAIVWLTCRQRVRRPRVAPWLKVMFRPGTVAAVGFVLAMTAFGAVDLFGRRLAPEMLAVFLTAALLHYYYDGFVWKARDRELRGDLGIQGSVVPGGMASAVTPGLRHAARWSLFFVPLLAIVAFGRGSFTPRERAEALAAVAPGDFLSRADLGLELARSGEVDAALGHYRASVDANPDYAQSRANYGAALDLAGDLGAAREQYEAALACRDSGGAHRQAHLNLGVLLLYRGDTAAARPHLEAARELGGEHPIGRMLGMAATLAPAAPERRERLYTIVLQLDANQLDARVELGELLLEQRRFAQAVEEFEAAVRTASNFVPALVGLATAQAEMGARDAARATLEEALRWAPGDPDALALRSRLR